MFGIQRVFCRVLVFGLIAILWSSGKAQSPVGASSTPESSTEILKKPTSYTLVANGVQASLPRPSWAPDRIREPSERLGQGVRPKSYLLRLELNSPLPEMEDETAFKSSSGEASMDIVSKSMDPSQIAFMANEWQKRQEEDSDSRQDRSQTSGEDEITGEMPDVYPSLKGAQPSDSVLGQQSPDDRLREQEKEEREEKEEENRMSLRDRMIAKNEDDDFATARGRGDEREGLSTRRDLFSPDKERSQTVFDKRDEAYKQRSVAKSRDLNVRVPGGMPSKSSFSDRGKSPERMTPILGQRRQPTVAFRKPSQADSGQDDYRRFQPLSSLIADKDNRTLGKRGSFERASDRSKDRSSGNGFGGDSFRVRQF